MAALSLELIGLLLALNCYKFNSSKRLPVIRHCGKRAGLLQSVAEVPRNFGQHTLLFDLICHCPAKAPD